MVSKSLLFHGVVWAGLALGLWAAGAHAAAARYDTVTPHSPPFRQKYIPLHSSYESMEPVDFTASRDPSPPSSSTGLAPSQLILTVLKTALDVVRRVNANRRSTSRVAPANSTRTVLHRKAYNATTSVGKARGMYEEYDDHHEHHDTHPKPMKQGRYTDPWAGYYDWIINEGSFKFWSAFQLFSAALLLYACFSAVYYAKFNPIIPDYDREYDDYFLERTVGRKARSIDPSLLASGLSWITPSTFQFIMDAITTHYKDE